MKSFIANKKINFDMTNKMLLKCEITGIFTNSNNQYVNLLEKYIHEKFKISNNKAVICTMSGDGALHCLISSLHP
jgi:hypothetical protein